VDLLLHPHNDLSLPVLLPCNFAVYANGLVNQAQASAGLPERKSVEPAVPGYKFIGRSGAETEGLFVCRITLDLMWQQLDRRIDEYVLFRFFHFCSP
jgi:hypothetical protein